MARTLKTHSLGVERNRMAVGETKDRGLGAEHTSQKAARSRQGQILWDVTDILDVWLSDHVACKEKVVSNHQTGLNQSKLPGLWV